VQIARNGVLVRWRIAYAPDDAPIVAQTVLVYDIRNRLVGQVLVDADDTSARITGLRNGQSYRFAVLASNLIGPGPISAPSKAIRVG
jgi:hypothetical protein